MVVLTCDRNIHLGSAPSKCHACASSMSESVRSKQGLTKGTSLVDYMIRGPVHGKVLDLTMPSQWDCKLDQLKIKDQVAGDNARQRVQHIVLRSPSPASSLVHPFQAAQMSHPEISKPQATRAARTNR
ncbi:hypothetical protein VNO77_19168 [Canavalia gladiata]|uniref:Uncharacterized protein n=1 Tax=Canavalia gladiata TaxID=3824 RepID=A0AAN9QK96_CANGL